MPPKSRCTCGHTGDGEDSQHDMRYRPGHGACLVPNCPCKQFRWDKFLPGVRKKLFAQKAGAK